MIAHRMRLAVLLVLGMACLGSSVHSVAAEDAAPGNSWSQGVEVHKDAPEAKPPGTTVIERGGGKASGSVKLVALLTVDGQEIDQGMILRIFATGSMKPKLIAESRE